MLPQEKGDALLIIDPQNDFHPGGSLAIPTANEDARKIAKMIQKMDFSEIYVTLDSHSKYHIAHALFWVNKEGQHPAPFTKITYEDVQKKVWQASQPMHQHHAERYVKALEKSERFDLTIWPDHCLVGTPGHAVTPILVKALAKWEEKKSKSVHYIMKGTNALTEHYSAFKAEVALDNDPNTKLNMELIQRLKRHKFVFICGQAKSHCVNWSTRDLIDAWQYKSRSSLVVVSDATSPVKGFESFADDFEKECERQNVQSLSMDDVLKGEYKKADLSVKPEQGPGNVALDIRSFYIAVFTWQRD